MERRDHDIHEGDNMAKTQNMTTGSEAGHIIRFALPLDWGDVALVPVEV